MAVKIRLSRRGRKKLAIFDIIIADPPYYNVEIPKLQALIKQKLNEKGIEFNNLEQLN